MTQDDDPMFQTPPSTPKVMLSVNDRIDEMVILNSAPWVYVDPDPGEVDAPSNQHNRDLLAIKGYIKMTLPSQIAKIHIEMDKQQDHCDRVEMDLVCLTARLDRMEKNQNAIATKLDVLLKRLSKNQ